MEEEKPQPPDHQREQGGAAGDVPIYYNVTMFDEEDDDVAATTKFRAAMEDGTVKLPQKRAAAANALESDEEMAHRLYMQELMEMEEWELRDFDGPSSSSSSSSMDRPSSSSSSMDRPSSSSSSVDRPTSSSSSTDRPSSSSSSRAAAASNTTAPGKFWAGTPPYATNARERGTSDFESVQDAESGTEFIGNSRIQGPLEALADNKRTREIRATSADRGAGRNTTSRFMRPGHHRDFSTTPARPAVLSNDAAGSSSSAQAQHDSVSTARRALLAEADSEFIFAGMDEWHDGSWYDDDDDEEEPEQVEVDVQSLTESLQSCRLKSEPAGCNPSAATQGHEFSLQDFCERWGVAPSDMHPDEPSPSAKVAPLADHEVPTFYCGMCMDTLPVFDLFHRLPCAHTFCAPCMTTHLQYRVGASELPIRCPEPECGGGVHLQPDKCKKAIDYATFGDWGAQLAESAIPPNKRAYCLNQGCDLTMVETSGVAERVSAPCPECGHPLVRKRGA